MIIIINPYLWNINNQEILWKMFLNNEIVYDIKDEKYLIVPWQINYNLLLIKENFLTTKNNYNLITHYISLMNQYIKNINNHINIHKKYQKNIYYNDESIVANNINLDPINLDPLMNLPSGYLFLLIILWSNTINDCTFIINDSIVTIKIRWKGIYKILAIINKDLYNNLVNQWIFTMKLDLISLKPQSGVLPLVYKNNKFNMRFSFYPVDNGIKTSIRLLQNQYTQLNNLKIHPQVYHLLLNIIAEKTFFAIGGVSSTGKTSLAYGINKQLVQWGFHVMSIENPIEYPSNDFDQAHEKIVGNDFLPHLMRHDLDTIFVGEILTENIANLTIEAIATGHGVIGTIHIQSMDDLKYRWRNLEKSFYKGYGLFPKIFYYNNHSYTILTIYNWDNQLLTINEQEQIDYWINQ